MISIAIAFLALIGIIFVTLRWGEASRENEFYEDQAKQRKKSRKIERKLHDSSYRERIRRMFRRGDQ